MFIRLRLSNDILNNEFVGLKLANNGSVSLIDETNGLFKCSVSYLGNNYDVSFSLDKDSYALLDTIKLNNEVQLLNPNVETILLYAAVSYLRNRGEKYASYTMLERVDKTISSMQNFERKDYFSPVYFALTIAGLLSKKEYTERRKTLNSILLALRVTKRKKFDWDIITYIIFLLANYLDFADEEIIELTKERFSRFLLSTEAYELDFYFNELFWHLDQKTVSLILQAILEIFSVDVHTKISSSTYSKLSSIAEIAKRYGKLDDNFLKVLFSSPLATNELDFTYFVKYAITKNLDEALSEISNNAIMNLRSDVRILFIRYAFDHQLKNCNKLLEELILSPDFSFSDYLWYKNLKINEDDKISESSLELIAKNHNFLGAYRVYNHKPVTINQLKNMSTKDIYLLKDILLNEYKKPMTEMLIEQIDRKISYKNIEYNVVLKYMSLLREFSPVEYGKMRNNSKVKMHLGDSTSFRYEDVISLYKSNQLETNKIYIYKK